MNKTCYDCKELKPMDSFYKRKDSPDGYRNTCKTCFIINSKNFKIKNEDKHREHCKNFRKKYPEKISMYRKKSREKLKKERPWAVVYTYIIDRCRRYERYVSRGIKCCITKDELKTLWHRDKAWLLERPTIDRKDNNGNYTFENCRFIELVENAVKESRKPVVNLKTGIIYESHREAARQTGINLNTIIEHCKGRVVKPYWILAKGGKNGKV